MFVVAAALTEVDIPNQCSNRKNCRLLQNQLNSAQTDQIIKYAKPDQINCLHELLYWVTLMTCLRFCISQLQRQQQAEHKVPRRFFAIYLGLALLAFALPESGKCGTVVYSNGPIDGSINGWTISGASKVTNSFTVTYGTNIGSASFGTWAQAGVTPNQVYWTIGTSAFGAQISSGTSSVLNTVVSTHQAGTVYDSLITLSGYLTPGTYYFTLQNATSTPGSFPIFWDQNNGSSSAESDSSGTITTINSESFTIYQDNVIVPEPSSVVMGVSGLSLLTWISRRRKKSA